MTNFSLKKVLSIVFYLTIFWISLAFAWELPLNNKYLEKNKKTKFPKKFSFIVVGDNRDGDKIFKIILQKIKELKPKPLLVINTGDMVPSGKKEQYENLIAILDNFDIPLIGVAGNHDYEGLDNSNFKKYFGKSNFYFDINNYRFLILDNADGILSKEELTFAEKALSTSKTKFVFLHKPPGYSVWKFHSFSTGSAEFMKLMDEKKVAYVFMGHIHAFDFRKIKNVNYVLAGGGGAPLYKMPGLQPLYHFVIIEVSKDKINLKLIKIGVKNK